MKALQAKYEVGLLFFSHVSETSPSSERNSCAKDNRLHGSRRELGTSSRQWVLFLFVCVGAELMLADRQMMMMMTLMRVRMKTMKERADQRMKQVMDAPPIHIVFTS